MQRRASIRWLVPAPVRRLVQRTKPYEVLSQAREIARNARWTPEDEARQAFYASFVDPGDLCFDVGANVGKRTRTLLRLGARVVAVEPQTRCATILRVLYGRNPRFALEQCALAATAGDVDLLIGETHQLTTLGGEWLTAVRASGRFGAHDWSRRERVHGTTLDALVERHGTPRFVKVDVEGAEAEVIRGLSRAVDLLSFEWTPEYLAGTQDVLEHLASLGPISCNFELGETARLSWPEWIEPAALLDHLREMGRDTETRPFGDVFVRFDGRKRAR